MDTNSRIKPETFQGDLANLPAALGPLTKAPCWVGWKWEWKEDRGKWTKPPLAIDGRYAKVSDPETWTSYTDCLAAYNNGGGFNGIGFVLTEDDGLSGADLDKVRDPKTGKIEQWAAEIISIGETYCEISPSGTGLRLFWKGKVSRAVKNDLMSVEIYGTRRYLTITGLKVAGCPDEIRAAPLTEAALRARVAGKPVVDDDLPEYLKDYEPRGLGVETETPESPWKKLNNEALENPEKWIFDLFGPGIKKQSGGEYRISSKILRRKLQEDLVIYPTSIKDFGVADQGDEKEGWRSPLDVVMEWSEPQKDLAGAADWLRAKLYLQQQGQGAGTPPPGTSSPGPQPSSGGSYLMSSKQFVAGFVAPDYLIKNLLLTACIYSFTAPTGTGKTAVTMRLAAHVATGISVAGKKVKKGRVLYFAGENPVDIRMRWIKLCEVMGLDPDQIEVHFLDGARPIFTADFKKDLDAYLKAVGEILLLIIDTSAAYFVGDDENNNVQAKNHAAAMREFTKVKGKPTVIVNCHPTKNPDMTNLLPKGGGNFLNEVDGNIVGIGDRGSKLIEIDTHGKFRGPDFPPFSFKIIQATSEKIKDSDGDYVWTVYAEPIGEGEKAIIENAQQDRKQELLAMVAKHPEGTFVSLAEALRWTTKSGEFNRSLVSRLLTILENEKKIIKDGNRRKLTAKGKKALEEGSSPDGNSEKEDF